MPAGQTRSTRTTREEEPAAARTPRPLPTAPEGGFRDYTSAMAWVQEHLPVIEKDLTARITPREGGATFTYSYADLADVSHAILPLLGRAGLVWTTIPTVKEDGRTMVLKYELRHTSGDHVEGVWPISGSSPQQLGSAITYGRRYALMAVTGVFPGGEDDDGAAAAPAYRRDEREPEPRAQSSRPASPSPLAQPATRQAPDVDGFVQAVTEAVASGEPHRLENVKQSAWQRFAVHGTDTPVPDHAAGGEVVTARELLVRAAAAMQSTATPPAAQRTRVRADPATVAKTLDQWTTPEPATAGAETTSTTEGTA